MEKCSNSCIIACYVESIRGFDDGFVSFLYKEDYKNPVKEKFLDPFNFCPECGHQIDWFSEETQD